MMKKTILLFITLSVMALAVVFAFTHTYAPQDKVLKENVAALADDPITDDEDGSSELGGGGGGVGVTFVCTPYPDIEECKYTHSCGQKWKGNNGNGYFHAVSGMCTCGFKI